jgi:hypothetical protein
MPRGKNKMAVTPVPILLKRFMKIISLAPEVL